ncbi:hypothetical protein BH09CHL1_BH09CHL1_33870 [soil metagenome]
MIEFFEADEEIQALARRYAALLEIEHQPTWITGSKALFEDWIGRKIGSSLGGAYVYSRRRRRHLILINRPRLNPELPIATELVVAEELIHLRDWVIGDRRRHSKHGYDRIAHEVARVTGASLDDIRNCLKPTRQLPFRWIYRCPGCGMMVKRKRKGIWSCARCANRFDPRFVLQLVGEIDPVPVSRVATDPDSQR